MAGAKLFFPSKNSPSPLLFIGAVSPSAFPSARAVNLGDHGAHFYFSLDLDFIYVAPVSLLVCLQNLFPFLGQRSRASWTPPAKAVFSVFFWLSWQQVLPS